MPGGGLDDITAATDVVSEGAKSETLYIIHAGTNDVQSTRTEEIMDKYRRLIRRYKEKSNNVIVSGILPRFKPSASFHGKTLRINHQLWELCVTEGVGFMNGWSHFNERTDLYRDDGLHLNEIGGARLGRLLHDAVIRFSKNGKRFRGTDSP